MFICLLTCLFVDVFVFFFILIILEHPQEYALKVLWKSDWIWLRYIGFLKMFTCLFVCLFVFWPVCFFYFNHLGTPTGVYPENFVKIGLDLAEIYRILKNVYLFVCLFVCLLTCFFYFNHLRTPTGIYPENFVKIQLDLADIFWI